MKYWLIACSSLPRKKVLTWDVEQQNKQTNKQTKSVLTDVLGAKKNRLNETVLLSTHNIYVLVEN